MAIFDSWTSTNNNVTINFDNSLSLSIVQSVKLNVLSALQSSTLASRFFGDTANITVAGTSGGSRYDRDANVLYLSASDNAKFISPDDGKVYSASTLGIFVHELTHAIVDTNELMYDLVDALGPIPDEGGGPRIASLLDKPATDWLGATVRFTNSVMSVVTSIGDAQRGHYISNFGATGLSSESQALLKKTSFTFGHAIDAVVQGSALNPDSQFTISRDGSLKFGSTTVASSDLMISYEGADTLIAGAGRDFVYAGGDNDIVYANKADADGAVGSGTFSPTNSTTPEKSWDPSDSITDYLFGGSGLDIYWVGASTGTTFTGSAGHYAEVQNVNSWVWNAGGFNTNVYGRIDILSDSDGKGIINYGLDGNVHGSNPNDSTTLSISNYKGSFSSDAPIEAVETVVILGNDRVEYLLKDLDPDLIGSPGRNIYAHFEEITVNGVTSDRLIVWYNEWIDVRESFFSYVLFAIDGYYAGIPISSNLQIAGDALLAGLTAGTTGSFGINIAGYRGSFVGGALDDTIDGTIGNDDIEGGAGSDVLNADGGNDVLNGGAGADTLVGGAGNDVYYVDAATDVVTEVAAEGNDIVYSSVTMTNRANVEWVLLSGAAAINATGLDAWNDTLTGNGSANTLAGLTGNDVLDGGAGDDWIDGGAGADQIAGGLGLDYASYAFSASGVTVSLATGAGTGGEAQGDALSGIENLYGSAFADNFTGDGQSNTLYGLGGNDVLNGGAGTDTLIGGVGNDVYYVDVATDVLIEVAAAGNDIVFSSVTLTNRANVEWVLLSGAAAINATGLDAWNDTLTGNSAANTLAGLTGNDVLDGGAGDDWIDGGAGADQIAGGLGLDYASFAFSASGVTVSLATGTGTGGEAQGDTLSGIEGLYGSAFADSFTGDALSNYLHGLGGSDVLNGGAGVDTLIGGTGIDVFRFDTALNATTNRDSITDFSSVDDTIQLENAVFLQLFATGTLAVYLFKNLSLGAIDADDRVLYNPSTGALSYDADGFGIVAAIQFASLAANTALFSNDFVVT